MRKRFAKRLPAARASAAFSSCRGCPATPRSASGCGKTGSFKSAQAREAQADFLADEMIEIADGTGSVQRDRLRIEARMWYAGKLRPKKYGTKPDATTVNVGVGVATYVLTEERRAELIAKKRAAIERRLAASEGAR